LTGDLRNRFTELTLLDTTSFDREGPIWIRTCVEAPGFYEVAVLYSDAWGAHERYFYAYETTLSPLGTELLNQALADDVTALAKAGRFMLEKLGDFQSARIYLERAFLAGAEHLALDLAVAALFSKAEGR
jgi:hypothetical protein